ncbi:MAG: 50S ribosomal protein L11 methyltransferase, partial [Thermomicrobiales bacterium]|nr:50S ribosomal protein L11 methyltransferase [Thermomicrobiales bacterium]
VAERIRTALGTAEPGGEFQGPYDVVVANIISRVLVELSDGLANAVKPGGLLIMSGVIESREPLVREAFEPRGFQLIDREQIDDWVGLTYRAPL